MHFNHHHRGDCGSRGRFFGPRGFGRFGGRGFGEGRPEGGRRRVFDSGELRLVVLKLIADEPRHGYDVIRAIEDLTGGAYAPSPGVVYPTLTLLQDMGQITEAAAEGTRRAYAVTAEGTAHLAEKQAEVDALLARLAGLAAVREKTDGAPIRRAMGNLKAVLMHRLGSDDVTRETLHEVAEILDEAARRIERL